MQSALGTRADQADAAARNSLDYRDADLFFEATGDDIALLEINEKLAAHDAAPRLAAANASARFE